jgi:hypothetical protein
MAKAWLTLSDPRLTPQERALFRDIVRVGGMAESFVASEKEWVRNGDRVKEENLGYEIGDVLMMLTVFSALTGYVSPEECMLEKMKAKGFQPKQIQKDEYDEQCPDCHRGTMLKREECSKCGYQTQLHR